MKVSTQVQVPVASVRHAIEAEAHRTSALVEKLPDSATVGMLDSFERLSEDKPSHGEKVHSVLLASGLQDRDVARIENGTSQESNRLLSELLFQPGPESFQERLEAYIELSVSHVLAKTNGTLSQLEQVPGLKLKTLNQSQGSSRAGVYGLLSRPALDWQGPPGSLSDFGEKLADLYEIAPGTPEVRVSSLNQHLIDHVDRVVSGSSFLLDLQQEHTILLEQLRQKGVLVVTSAGNDADEAQALKSQGLSVPDDFDDDVTAIGPKLVVGALDTKGTESSQDDHVAFFSSVYPAVDVLAPGVNVQTLAGPATGTSYAAPIVAAEAEQLRRTHPEWTVDTVEQAIISRRS